MLGRILLFLGGSLVVALFAALLAPLFVNWTDFRAEFELSASRILGQKVTVNGAVEARILPLPSVTMHDVTVGRGDDGQPLVHVARFSMDAELAPFLSGEARIYDMRVEEPKVRLKLLKDGTLDWLRGSRADISGRNVVLENVDVSDGQVEFIDDQTGRTRVITNLQAEMSAQSLAGPWTISGTGNLDGEAGRFNLSSGRLEEAKPEISLKARITPDARPFEVELDGSLAVKEGRPGYAGRFTGKWKTQPVEQQQAGQPPAPAVAGPRVTGEFELTNERVRVPAYRLELGDANNPYAVTGEATLDTGSAPEFLLTADGQQIDVSRIGNEGAKGKTGRNAAASVRQRLNRLIEIAGQIPVPTVPGRATLSLPAIVAGDTVVRDIKLDVQPAVGGWTIERAVAVLPGRTQIESKGRLTLTPQPSFNGEMLVASTQPTGLASWLSGAVDPAIRELRSAGFSALVDITPDLQRFERLELAIGPATLKGRVERESVDGSKPALSIDLSGNAIDLDAIRALGLVVAGEDGGDSLFSHRIGARLKVDRFTAYGVEASGVDTIFTLADGATSLEKLNIEDIAGARIRASAHGEGGLTDYRGNAKLSFSAFDVGPFLSIVRPHLPQTLMLDRLAENASWFANTDLNADIDFAGQDGSLGVKLGGAVNGGRVDATYSLASLSAPGGAMQLDATLENPDTSVLLGQIGLRPLPLPADGDGRVTLGVKREDGPAEVAFEFSTDATRVALSGALSAGENGRISGAGKATVESADLDPYLIMNGLALPQSLTGLPVEGTSEFAIDGASVSLSGLDITLDHNRVAGSATVDWSGAAPRASGKLAFDTLDLPWLAENMLGPVDDPLTGEPSTIAVTAAPWGEAEARFEVEARTFTTGFGEPVDGFSAGFNLTGDRLVLDDVRGQWLGGATDGRLMIANTDGNAFGELRLNVKGGDVARFYGEDAPATGAFDLSIAAETSGESVDALLSSINGSGTIGLSGLSVASFDLGFFDMLLTDVDRGAGNAISQETVAPMVQEMLDAGRGEVGSVQFPFNITASSARAQNASATTENARISADARVDLRNRAVDGGVTVSLNAGEEALDGADPAFRLSLAGDVFAPAPSLDVTELTNYLSLRAFERERRRVETLQSNLLEKQRLRREVLLYRYQADQRAIAREKAEALQAAMIAEEQRLKAAAEERKRVADEARREAEEEARRRAEEEAQQRAAEPETTESVPDRQGLPVEPKERVTRGGLLPPALNFENLPGVQP